MLPNVADCAVEAGEVARLPRNRLVSRFDTVFRLCEWFLAGQSPNVHAGEERSLGLLFDMNVLFEEFVAKILRSIMPNGYRLQTQGPRIYLARDTNTGDNRFQMKPDICIVGADGAVKVVIDTKWKLVDALDAKSKYGVQQADMYQLRTYADAYRCDKVALWYPASSQINDASTLAIFEFLQIGGEPIGSSVAINALELRKQFSSGHAWKENMYSQALRLVSILLIGDPQQEPFCYSAPCTM
jgi:5-methylcytosine-specific restriction enzyme subunit McrC